MKKGLKVSARAGRGEIYLYGVIGDDWYDEGVTANDFSKELKGLGAVSTIDLHIDSEGGDVFQGRTIYSLVKAHPANVTVYVDGLAASAASLIAMAGDEIVMADGSFIMIHEAWGSVRGRASDLRKRAELMDQINETMVQTYVSRSGQDANKIRKMMDEETWMEAKEAIDLGFADTIAEPMRVAASVHDAAMFKNLPAKLRPRQQQALAVISGMRNPATRR